ncbi:MAG TPA: glycosyltransferase family 39 protein [Leptospiraceae bacterium]|nr:glycosyltransferase family 39 protein [Leptospiraceae bacterium]HNF16064.1 glycosyltransferase family 39 protein [Leptospiraceae bacterium]HNM05662.1 glycosyltransferase family 39 protein [Leptospiraceae bacterium]HNN04364.1 glycosyltransferase family 39 protein [Leptospiraceae bacterium]
MELDSRKQKLILGILFIAALGLRLWNVTNDLNDFHHFRQTYTAAFAKHFYEYSMNIFKPNLDILNYKNISEFQIYAYMVAVFYKIFGFHDIIGRFISIFFSALSFFVFYRLVEKVYDSITALIAAFLFSFLPLMIFYSRVFMLESMMLFLSISLIYTSLLWIETEEKKYMAAAGVFTALTLLIKIPTLYMLIPVAFMILNRYGFRFLLMPRFYIFGVLSITPALYWYFLHARLFPEDSIVDKEAVGIYYSREAWEYYFYLMKNPATWAKIFLEHIAEYHLAVSVFLFALAGIFLNFRSAFSLKKTYNYTPNSWIFPFWVLGFIVFILAFIAPNAAHEYYQLPIVPPMIAIAAFYLRNILEMYLQNRSSALMKTALLIHAILLLSILPFSYGKLKARLTPDPFYNRFGDEAKKLTDRKDLVVVLDNTPRTEVFYFSDRRGFQLIMPGVFQFALSTVPPEIKTKYISELEDYRSKGAKYFFTPYGEFAVYIPWFKQYLDEKYECLLGCNVTPEMVVRKDPSIKGFIYRLSEK